MQSQSWSSVCIANEEKVRIDPTTRLVSAYIPHLVQHNPIFVAPMGCTYRDQPKTNIRIHRSWLNSCWPFSRMHFCNLTPKFYLVLSFVRKIHQNLRRTKTKFTQSLICSVYRIHNTKVTFPTKLVSQIFFFMTQWAPSFLQDFASAGRGLWCSSNSLYRAPSSTQLVVYWWWIREK